ncbi:hypothetical protein ES703_90716 [subsurface metagenome]
MNFVKVRVSDSAGKVVYFTLDDPAFWDFISYLEKVYPVPGVRVWRGGTVDDDWTVPVDLSDVLYSLWWYNFWTDDPDDCFHTHYYGMIHPNYGNGGMGYYDGSVCDEATGFMSTAGSGFEYPYGASTLAHELGHNLMRPHTGCQANEANPDPNWPTKEGYDPCNIGPTNDPTAYYGFDIYNPTSSDPVIEPWEAGPIMSYRDPAWIDDYTYRGLYNHFKNPGGYYESEGSSIPNQASEFLVAAGLVNTSEQTATLDYFYRIEEPRDLSESQNEGDIYSLVLEDDTGQTLYTHDFTLKTYPGRYGTSSDYGFFGEVFPYDPQTARIVLLHGETGLASKSVSANAPEVRVIYPNGGEVLDESVILEWTGSDADGDQLIYTVQYSPDEGETWKAVSENQLETTFELDLDWIPGGSSAFIRVIASDGVNTGMDQSDAVFAVAGKSPKVYIREPSDDSIVPLGELVIFSGTALDPNNALAWSSDVDGVLGYGEEFWTSNLSSGPHVITLTATDSAGNIGTASITLYIPTVESISPVADTGGPYSGHEGSPITFDASGSYDPDGEIVSWEWRFGDGTTGLGEVVTHAYAALGNYTVTLAVTSDDGEFSIRTAAVSVEAEPTPGTSVWIWVGIALGVILVGAVLYILMRRKRATSQ